MSFSHEKRENEEFYDEKFLTRKTRLEKNEKLTTLKLRFLGIYEAHFKIFCLKSKISKKLSHKNAINYKNKSTYRQKNRNW